MKSGPLAINSSIIERTVRLGYRSEIESGCLVVGSSFLLLSHSHKASWEGRHTRDVKGVREREVMQRGTPGSVRHMRGSAHIVVGHPLRGYRRLAHDTFSNGAHKVLRDFLICMTMTSRRVGLWAVAIDKWQHTIK